MPTNNDPAFAIELYLYNAIQSATATNGLLNASTQVNPNGGTGIQLVERNVPPVANVFPSVGIRLDTVENDVAGTHRDVIVAHYDIVVAYLQPFNPTATSAAAADTRLQARLGLANYVSDGNGNGMTPLLRQSTMRTMGGLCYTARIESTEIQVYDGKDSTAGTIAAAWYRFEAKALVSW